MPDRVREASDILLGVRVCVGLVFQNVPAMMHLFGKGGIVGPWCRMFVLSEMFIMIMMLAVTMPVTMRMMRLPIPTMTMSDSDVVEEDKSDDGDVDDNEVDNCSEGCDGDT